MIDRLANPEALALLLLVPVLLWGKRRGRRDVAIGLPAPPGRALPRSLRARLTWLPGVLRVLALVLLALAVARPQDVAGQTRTRTEGVAIQIVVDRSGSMDEPMDADGRAVRKMDVVKAVLERFILGDAGAGLEPREGDMLGLIAFARYADTVCPLVRGRDAVAGLVRTLDTVKVRSEDGTAIGDGVALAAARLRRAEEELAARRDESLVASRGGSHTEGDSGTGAEQNDEADGDFSIKSKVIVLVTDGVNNAGSTDPLEAARLAAEWGIKVYVIGVGAGPRYVTMQTFAGEQRVPVGPSLDEASLRAIAEATDGMYFPATDAESLVDIYARIGRLERSEIHVLEFDDVTEWYAPLAMSAGALVALEGLLAATWLRRGP